MLSLLDSKTLFGLLVWVQLQLFIPIILYIVIILVTGIYLHAYISCLIIGFYFIILCLISARWYLFIIQIPGRSLQTLKGKLLFKKWETPYWSLFTRYIGRNKKLVFSGIKIYSCAVLYLMVINQTRVEYDLSMIILFFSLGILGHGLIIHQLRDLEESRLTFYRTVPRSLSNRFIQYAILYFILLLPEIITIVLLTPYYLHFKDAILLILFSYSVLMFLNSLLFIQFFKMKDYLKIILCIFLLIYFSVLTATIPLLCILLFISSMAIFFGSYYQYER
jgi:hypothetical protein